MAAVTGYSHRNDVHIAYQTVGQGEHDLIYLPGLWSHVEHVWREPGFAAFLRGLSSFSRLIVLDTRGAGLSDRSAGVPLLEEQIDDVISVMDAVGSEQAIVLGVSQSGPLAALMAASHPDRVSGLVLYGTYATALADDDHPWGRSREWIESYIRRADAEWGTGTDFQLVAPSKLNDKAFREWWARLERYSNAPGDAMGYIRAHSQDDVRPILPTIAVPTLVLHRVDDEYRTIELARYLAAHIPDARLVELSGEDHLPYLGDSKAILAEIEEFATGARGQVHSHRMLATLLFTDIVDSTVKASHLGDSQWRALLTQHNELTREALSRYRGREINTTGDGFLALFDGPARAIECARSIVISMKALGVDVRAGIHTGEVEVMGDDVGGIAVHIGSRVASKAGPAEVMVSRTVKDLVAGSSLVFEDRGSHHLKGVSEEWQLYSIS